MSAPLKSGDLVICVESPAFPEFVGRIFTLTTPCEVYSNHWDTDPPQIVSWSGRPCSFDASTLRPIRDPGDDAVDETLIYAGDPRVREVSHG